MSEINRPRTTTLDTVSAERRAPIARVRLRRPAPRATALGSGPVAIPFEDVVVAATVTRDELARRVREKLIRNGSDPGFADMVIRPGFFANPDGLEVIARKLGVLESDEVVE